MVVVAEPAVKGDGAFVAWAVDSAVSPAGEHRADESLGFPVCLRPVGAGAEVFQPQPSAGDCMHDGAVGAAVVGEDRLDADAVASVEASGAVQEADSRARFLVR